MNIRQLKQILENAKENGVSDETKVVLEGSDHSYLEVFSARFVQAENHNGEFYEAYDEDMANTKVLLIHL